MDEQLEEARSFAVVSETRPESVENRVRYVKHLPPKCLPVNHLAFLPMIQAKSHLLQAVFIHYGLKHELR